MNYTEVQIRQADAALRLMHETKGSVDGHNIYQVMGPPKAEYMRMVLCDVLHLVTRNGNSYVITEDGEKAYKMGFKDYMEERERKAEEPVPVKEVREEHPWYWMNRRELLQSVISSTVGAVVGSLVTWLLMR